MDSSALCVKHIVLAYNAAMSVQHLQRPDGGRIAYRRIAGREPGILWLSGFKSDMSGTKATYLAEWAAREGRAYLAFDYFGHGASSGDFREGTIGRWREDGRAVLDQLTSGPQVLVGSSMGGWIALLLALARPERVKALALLAPAPDFTEDLIWERAGPEAKAAWAKGGIWHEPSDYGDPYPITLALIEEGRRHLLLRAAIPIACPVYILHGMKDADVPFGRSLALAERLESEDVLVEFTKSGDHRLSGKADLERLAEIVAKAAGG